MGMIWTSKTRTKQPQGPVSSNPSVVGAGIVLDLSNPATVDPSGRVRITYRSGTATVTRGHNGRYRALRFASQPTGHPVSSAHVQIPPVVPLSGPFTLLLCCRPSAFSNDNAAYLTGGISTHMNDGSGSGPALRWGLGLDSASRKKLVGFARIGGADVTINDGTDCVEGTDYVVALVYDGAALRMYKNGAQVASSAASGSVEVTRYTALVVGDDFVTPSTGADGYQGRGFSGDLYTAGVMPEGWGASKVASVARNPWQLFAPERTPVFYSISGSPSAIIASYRMRRPGLSRVWR